MLLYKIFHVSSLCFSKTKHICQVGIVGPDEAAAWDGHNPRQSAGF